MVRRVTPGQYRHGEIHPEDPMAGEYGVIKGENVNVDGEAWDHICAGALKTSKWFVYRLPPEGHQFHPRGELLEMFDTKTEAGEWIEENVADKFDRVFKT